MMSQFKRRKLTIMYKPLRCPECGSCRVDQLSENEYQCQSCNLMLQVKISKGEVSESK